MTAGAVLASQLRQAYTGLFLADEDAHDLSVVYINLPATREAAVYDAIFKSIREHLL